MESKKYWGAVVAFDVFMFAAVYAWMAMGMEGAKNIVLFALWFVGVLAVVGGFVMDKTSFKKARPKYFYVWHALTDMALVFVLAWNAEFALAAVYAFGHFSIEAARSREPKAKEASQ